MRPICNQPKAFTVVELLVVLAAIALLVSVRLPALARAKSQTKIAQCAANLKQFLLASHIYATDNVDQMPRITNGFWAWDIDRTASDKLVRCGVTSNKMYCPAVAELNASSFWLWGLTYRVIGYATAFPGTPSVLLQYQISSLYPSQAGPTGPGQPPVIVPKASTQVLLADATLTAKPDVNPSLRATYKWTGIMGSYNAPGWPGHRAAHLAGLLPAGGNAGMLDGHVEWHQFTSLIPRIDPNAPQGGPAGNPNFWW